MTSHDRTPNAPIDPQSPGMTSQAAADFLSQAQRARTAVPAAIPSAVVTLGVLCATGTFGTLALAFAAYVPTVGGFDARLAVGILLACWIAAAIILPIIFRAPWRKGLAVRWVIYMALWALLWVLAALLPAPAGLGVSALFIALFAAACGIEAQRARTGA